MDAILKMEDAKERYKGKWVVDYQQSTIMKLRSAIPFPEQKIFDSFSKAQKSLISDLREQRKSLMKKIKEINSIKEFDL